MFQLTRVNIVIPLIAMLVLTVGKASALDLLQAYEKARQNDSSYLGALAQYEASRLDLPLAESANKPAIAGGLGLQHNDESYSPDGGQSLDDAYEQGELSLDLTQNLFDKNISYDIDAAEYAAEIASLQLDIAEQDLITRTTSAYLDVLSALDNQNLAELERAAIESQLDLATQRLEVGLGTRTDQYEAQARFEAANAELIATKNQVINAQQALEAVMGSRLERSPKEEIRPLEIELVSQDLVEGDAWVEQVLPFNTAYQIQQKQIDIQEVEVERSADLRMPSLGLGAGARAYDSNGGLAAIEGGDGYNWTVGLRGSWPIYQGGSIKLRQEKAGHAYNVAKQSGEQTRRDTDRLIRAARRGVQSLKGQVEALKQSVVAGKSALESKEEGFKAGVTTNLVVLDAQRDLFLAGRDYLRVSYDLVNAIVVLERSAGQLDQADVARINGWLK